MSYGEGRDQWDIRGRVAHESLSTTTDGRTAARLPSKDIRRSALGRVAWPGPYVDSPNLLRMIDNGPYLKFWS